jgi:hypothetical protein
LEYSVARPRGATNFAVHIHRADVERECKRLGVNAAKIEAKILAEAAKKAEAGDWRMWFDVRRQLNQFVNIPTPAVDPRQAALFGNQPTLVGWLEPDEASVVSEQ